jgi:hypothetical protein
MKRLMRVLSVVVLAAISLGLSGAAAYDESKHAGDAVCLRIDIEFARNARATGLRSVVGIDCIQARTIEISIAFGGAPTSPRPATPVWSALCGTDDGLLWRAAAAIRRRALEVVSDLVLRRKAH